MEPVNWPYRICGTIAIVCIITMIYGVYRVVLDVQERHSKMTQTNSTRFPH